MSVSDVGLVAPLSDVDKLLALSYGNQDIISTSSSAGRHLAFVLADSLRRGFWKNSMFSYVKVFSDPEVDSRLHLDILIFTEPLVSDSHLSLSRQSTSFGRISRNFYMNVNFSS